MMKIVIASHHTLASSLYATATMICGNMMKKEIHCIELDELGLSTFEHKVQALAETFHQEETLILCDLFGATPFNICSKYFINENQTVISGVNLAMVLSILLETKDLSHQNYVNLAKQSGKDGVLSNEGVFETYVEDSDDEFF